MSFERPYILGQETDAADVLARVAWNLSDKLHLPQKYESLVSLHRSMTEKHGDYYRIGNGEDPERTVEPIEQQTDVEFTARNAIDEDDGEIAREYSITSAVTQDIVLEELPTEARKSLDRLAEDDEVVGSLLDNRLKDMVGDDEALLQRRQAIEYMVDEAGFIYDFTLTFEYLLSQEIFHGDEFSPHVAFSNEVVTSSSIAAKTLEIYTPVANKLTQRNIRREVGRMKHFQLKVDEMMILEQAKSILEFNDEDQDRYARQAMSVLAVVTSGLFRMRDLRRYPKAWN